MTSAQEVIFQLLCKIDDICQENSIVYYLHTGTVLGAIRHGGFIPWDDDADVMMTRKNWEKFRIAFEADSEIHEKYGLEYYPSRKFHHQAFPIFKSRESACFFISLIASEAIKGFGLDIMIMDAVPFDEKLQKRQRNDFLRYSELLCVRYVQNRENTYWEYRRLQFFSKMFGRENVLHTLEKKISKYPENDTSFGYRQSVGEFPTVWEKKYLQEPSYYMFEGRLFPCPSRTTQFLRYTYGDNWMIMPPKELRHTHPHVELPHVPYTLVEKDYKPFINYKKVNEAWIVQKGRKLRAIPYEDTVRKTNSIKLAVAASLALKNKLAHAPVPIKTLFDNQKFAEAEELLKEYYAEQFGKRLSSDMVAIPIDENTFQVACLLLILRGEYYDAQTLINLHPEFAGEDSEIQGLVDLSREFSIVCYDHQDWDKAWELTEKNLPLYPHHTDFLSARLWLSLRQKRMDGREVICKAEAELQYHPQNDGLLFCKAEALNCLGQTEEAKALYRYLFQESRNGIICYYIQTHVEGMQTEVLQTDITVQEDERLDQLGSQAQEVLLRLLTEIREVCKNEEIPFFLGRVLASEAVELENFAPGCCSASIIMHPSYRKRFVQSMLRSLPPDRSLECFETNPAYPEFGIRYGDTSTLMFNVNESGFYRYNNICVKIFFIRRLEKSKYQQKFHDSIVAAVEATAYPSVFHNLTKKKMLAGTIAKTMMLFFGKKGAKKLLWNWVYRPKQASMTIHGSIKGYWYRPEALPQIDFGDKKCVFLKGEEFYIPANCPEFLSVKLKNRIANGDRIGAQPKYPRILSVNIPEQEYFDVLDKIISNRKYFRANQRISTLQKKNRPYQAITLRAWNIVKRSCSRFYLATAYAPIKEQIVMASHAGDYETLNTLLDEYIQELKVNLARGFVVIFDTEIFRITWDLLEQRGEYTLIKKLIPKIPVRHLTNLQIVSQTTEVISCEGRGVLMEKVTDQEKLHQIMEYLKSDQANCLYLLIDLSVYGLANPNIKVWCDQDEQGIRMVVMQYHESFQIYSNRSFDQIDGLLMLIAQQCPNCISARQEIIKALEPELSQYRSEYGFVLKHRVLDEKKAQHILADCNTSIMQATPNDALEIAQLLCTDEEFNKTYTVSSLAAELSERMETGMGRSFIIRDKEKLVAHVATYAELDTLAIGSGLIVSPEYRDTEYFYLLNLFIEFTVGKEGKSLYGMVLNINPRLLKTFKRTGCEIVACYGKMTALNEDV